MWAGPAEKFDELRGAGILITSMVLAVGGCAFTLISFSDAIKLTFATKLWLLEYAANLVG